MFIVIRVSSCDSPYCGRTYQEIEGIFSSRERVEKYINQQEENNIKNNKYKYNYIVDKLNNVNELKSYYEGS